MSAKSIGILVLSFIGALLIAIVSVNLFEKVDEGEVAVLYSPSVGAKEVFEPGWHFVPPFHKTITYPTRVQNVSTEVSVTTSDGKKITMPVKYEMKIDKSKVLDIFEELGSRKISSIQEEYLQQRLFAASREVISTYSVLDVFGTKTTEASQKVTELTHEKASPLGFNIQLVTLGNPEVDKGTQAAIDQRVKAAQENELKKQQLQNEKIEAEKKAVIAQGVAEEQRIRAEGDSEAKRIAADAEAYSNKTVAKSITPEILKQMELEARKKHGWVTIQGGTPIVDTK